MLRRYLPVLLVPAFMSLAIMTPVFLHPSPAFAQSGDNSGVEAAAVSRLTQIPLPKGTYRGTEKETVAQIAGGLEQAAKEMNARIEGTELLIWQGANSDARTVIPASLKMAGFSYAAQPPIKTESGPVTIFVAKSPKQSVVGLWIEAEGFLMLAWARVHPVRSGGSAESAGATERNAVSEGAASPASIPGPPKAREPDLSRLPKLAPEPGVAKGWVADNKGRPIAGARVRINVLNNAGRSHYAEVRTDTKGIYRAPLNSVYVYEVEARAPVSFHEMTYQLPCNPVGMAAPQAGKQGIVQNFVWTLSGVKRYSDNDATQSAGYIGGRIWMDYYPGRSLPKDAVVTFLLSPVGPLADGSTGTPLAYKRTIAALSKNDSDSLPITRTRMLHDIPVGVYRISASVELPGVGSLPLYLKVRGDDDRYQDESLTGTITFLPDSQTGTKWASVSVVHSPEVKQHLGE